MPEQTVEFDWREGQAPEDVIERIERLQRKMQQSLEDAMEEATLRILADARRNAPVDTGRLRADINQTVKRIAEDTVRGYVGNNVNYAPYQEFIHNPYLGPAVESNIDEVRALFVDAIESTNAEVSRS